MRVNIETDRLLLRQLEPSDYEAAFKWCGDPDVNTYLIYPLYHNAEDVKSWIESRDVDDPDNYDLGFVIKETGDLIGCGGMAYSPQKEAWIIGYNIRKDQWGNGYVVEAINGIIDHISKTRKIDKIVGEFAVDNYKSRRVMEKLGMHFDHDSEYTKLDGSATFKSKVYVKEF